MRLCWFWFELLDRKKLAEFISIERDREDEVDDADRVGDKGGREMSGVLTNKAGFVSWLSDKQQSRPVDEADEMKNDDVEDEEDDDEHVGSKRPFVKDSIVELNDVSWLSNKFKWLVAFEDNDGVAMGNCSCVLINDLSESSAK